LKVVAGTEFGHLEKKIAKSLCSHRTTTALQFLVTLSSELLTLSFHFESISIPFRFHFASITAYTRASLTHTSPPTLNESRITNQAVPQRK
jgi:hypothetical protein